MVYTTILYPSRFEGVVNVLDISPEAPTASYSTILRQRSIKLELLYIQKATILSLYPVPDVGFPRIVYFPVMVYFVDGLNLDLNSSSLYTVATHPVISK